MTTFNPFATGWDLLKRPTPFAGASNELYGNPSEWFKQFIAKSPQLSEPYLSGTMKGMKSHLDAKIQGSEQLPFSLQRMTERTNATDMFNKLIGQNQPQGTGDWLGKTFEGMAGGNVGGSAAEGLGGVMGGTVMPGTSGIPTMFDKLLGSAGDVAGAGAVAAAEPLTRALTGSKAAGKGAGAASSAAFAALQGGANIPADILAAYKLFDFIRSLF